VSVPERCGLVLLSADALPAGDAFLSPPERARAAGMKVEARRRDFLLGRLAARRALGAWLGVAAPGPELEVRAAPDGAPEVVMAGAPAISISHRAGHALCAVARPGLALGADLELVEPRSAEFVDQFFTLGEQALVRGAGEAAALWANLIWSAKESAAKALREGLRLDTRALEVRPEAARAGWSPVRVATPEGELTGWWCLEGSLVLTVVATAPIAPPERFERAWATPVRQNE
jgi:4'-phosphopantetheinyl transferase